MRVDPIRSTQDVDRIRKFIQGSPRDTLLFTLGLNTGLRIGDLLKLKVSDFENLKEGDSLQIIEQKTGKKNIIMVNKSIHKVFRDYLKTYNPKGDSYLFFSRKGSGPLTVQSCHRLVKSWCEGVGLAGNFGCHTLRKTFGYLQRTVNGVSTEILCTRFNHSSPRITMLYIGVTTNEVENVLMKCL